MAFAALPGAGGAVVVDVGVAASALPGIPIVTLACTVTTACEASTGVTAPGITTSANR